MVLGLLHGFFIGFGDILFHYALVGMVAFGHIAAVVLLVKSGAMRAIVERFAAVGRTALPNYLAHSLVMTTLFYGYGLGLYGHLPRVWQQALVVIVVGLQLLVSPWWLRHFRFGPMEWLWRSLTYRQRQPMRRQMCILWLLPALRQP